MGREIKFSVRMTVKEIYKFTLYHVYHGFSGLFGLGLSVLAAINLIVNFNEMTDQSKTIMTIVAAWFIILEPIMMLLRSRAQIKRTKAYQKPLEYIINQEGITVSQDEERQTLPWENLTRIIETRSQFLAYSSRVHAFIFPKNMLDGQLEDMRSILLQYVEGTNVLVKGKLKKYAKGSGKNRG